MKQIKFSNLLLFVLAFVGVVALNSCKKEPKKPVVESVLSITPSELVLTVGESFTFSLKENDKEIKASSWSVEPSDIASITATGELKALKGGKGKVIAKYDNRLVEAVLTVKNAPSKYYLPYLRFFDGADAIKEFEEARGFKLATEDPSMGYLLFDTDSELMPQIGYIVGQRSQVFASAEVLQSDDFIAFMKENGFETDRVVQSYGMMIFTTSKYKTVNPASVINMEGMPPGMIFSVIPPKISTLVQPFLDFNGDEAAVAAFEKARNYEQKNVRTQGDYKEVQYGILNETPEYYDLDVVKYLFKGDKLIKVTHLLAPSGKILVSLGEEAFNVHDEFTTLIKGMGYVTKQVKENNLNYKVYSLEEKHKFTLEQWTLKVKKYTIHAAGIAYVPADGPDTIEDPKF